MEKRHTQKGKSYWGNDGAYQDEYDMLYESLVPDSGDAPTIHGEMIRAVSRLFYDFCNNGNCNAIDHRSEPCGDCGGSGYEEEECFNCSGSGTVYDDYAEEEETCEDCDGSGVETHDCAYCGGDCVIYTDPFITDYFKSMVDFLEVKLINKKVVHDLIEFMERKDLGYGNYTFNDEEMGVYNRLVDEVMHQVLTTENRSRMILK